ncbi:hypothetical protein [Amycolatopsis sp. CA-230715]|uniref:hypothetical protein n=1 Tax=Amycolatopsis sp. CA-230715 TaxID=2745196 RepID=UPI001C018150|nr:hypothetical protein [Amycolatopsis sp. CA-230715]QWF84219.1 hypothetical protein HUW46_07668 [Amycolatopsis sp. CA-230715]
MPDFTVDIGGLDVLGKNLNRAKENLDGALKSMEDIGPDSIGPDDLDEACADFREDWERGIRKMGDCVAKITEALGAAKGKYADFENSLRDNLTKMAQKVEAGSAGQPEPPTMGPAR